MARKPEYQSFVLPFPPSANHTKAPFIVGCKLKDRKCWARLVPTKAATLFKKIATARLGADREPLKGPLAVVLHVTPPPGMHCDAPNFEKLPCDALTRAKVWEDDSQIQSILIVKHPSTCLEPRGQVVVWVQKITTRQQWWQVIVEMLGVKLELE